MAELSELLAQHDGDLAMVPGLALLAELYLECGQSDGAAASGARLAEMTARDVGSALTGYARLTEGLVAAKATDPNAADVLRTAIRLFAAARLPLEQARAQAALAQAVAASDPGVALAEARHAADAFARLGTSSEYDRVSSLLRSLGGRASPLPHTDGLLTSRERDVLNLVAEGLSNPQIAERLFLSRRTVAHHVSNILAKLGVHNRAEAAAWLVTHSQELDSSGSSTRPRSKT